MMAFTFQPQNVVANPDVFFFKADTYEHREKLKTIFPYVLGAITPEVLAAQHELELVRRELTRKERELTNIRQVSERWLAELRTSASRAREYGLVEEPIRPESTRDQLYDVLSHALEVGRWHLVNLDGVNEAVQELVELEQEESTIELDLRGLRRRMNEMSKLKENAEKYNEALRIQRDRLSIAKWLHGMEATPHSCPFCDNPINGHAAKLAELYESLEMLETQATKIVTMPASFDREMTRVRQEVKRLVDRLNGIILRKKEVESRSEEAEKSGLRSSEVSRFIGQIEQGLQVHAAMGEDGTLAAEVAELKEREATLSKIVSSSGMEGRKNAALRKISANAQRHLPNLDAERPKDPVTLSINDLTIKVTGQSRDDYLWEIGSGANWLSYHVAVTLGLQEFFIDQRHSPVPRFLVYDQPSQVYFPRRLASTRRESEDDPKLLDEDVAAVQKVFTTLANAIEATKGRLQIIVLDHAGRNVWGDIDGVVLIEKWRNNKKLIPLSWLPDEND